MGLRVVCMRTPKEMMVEAAERRAERAAENAYWREVAKKKNCEAK
jgi:hypothetical protein